MSRPLLLVGLGAAVGYAYGFRDAQQHDQTVVRRAVAYTMAHAGGGARKYNADLDGRAAPGEDARADSLARR